MKTKKLISTLLMVMGALTHSFGQAQTGSGNWLNAFSLSEYVLIGLCGIMLAVIWILAKTVRTLSEQMR